MKPDADNPEQPHPLNKKELALKMGISVNVTVEVAGANQVPVTIPIGMRECFSSDVNCSLTSDDCY